MTIDGGPHASRRLVQGYIVGLPIFWLLGFDFLAPLVLAILLIGISPAVHVRFCPADYLLAGVILSLGFSAYLNGYLLSHQTIRSVAALYNLSLWICGLIVMQQVRDLLMRQDERQRGILGAAAFAFFVFTAAVWGSVAIAYVRGDFLLEAPSVFGLAFGYAIPDSAALIKQSATLVFTRPDWGLPGVPMPRVAVYGPYPTATAGLAAMLGSLALLYLQRRDRFRPALSLTVEASIYVTLALTLTRSILAGWLIGAIAANLLFGSVWRRFAVVAALGVTVAAFSNFDFASGIQYREYSTESRFENYDYALERTLAANPLLGLGVKPREEGNHIAIGSHSTFVSTFTKGGAIALAFAVGYLVLVPAARWLVVAASSPERTAGRRAELRILLNLQVAIWAWLCFEDVDAPAAAAMLVFISFAFIESALRRQQTSHEPRFLAAERPCL